MRWVRVADLQEGMRIQLTGRQELWDVSVSPWRKFGSGSRYFVLSIRQIATGRVDRQPFELNLQEADSGARLVLEVADGAEVVMVSYEATRTDEQS